MLTEAFNNSYYGRPDHHFKIHPDYYPAPPLEDPYTETEREALREELRKKEEAEARKKASREEDKARRLERLHDQTKRQRARARARKGVQGYEGIPKRLDTSEAWGIIEESPGQVYIIDTETTGLHSEKDDVLEVSIINAYGVTVHTRRYNSWFSEWPEAQEVHGISPEDVQGLPTLEADAG